MTGDVIKGFNRDTWWLATGVLSTVVSAALVLAVHERQSNATQAKLDLLLNASPATVASVIAQSPASDDKIASGPGSSVDHTFTGTLLEKTPTSIPEFTPEKNRNVQRQDSARVEPKSRNVRKRSFLASRFINVKRRLIELWHQSLGKSETRSWTAFSKLDSGVKKKTAYTAATRD